jgi:hypothetical protein
MLLHSRILGTLALATGLLVAVGAILARNAQNPGASADEILVFTADTRPRFFNRVFTTYRIHWVGFPGSIEQGDAPQSSPR